ncbi:Aldehyde/histidinol dehydrogenase [Fusarium oxysporum f. sp. albedinis]|nr:Aldehyde/histidinol dehydrogenase [Fusarium oxysporum f. sp. albedinis]
MTRTPLFKKEIPYVVTRNFQFRDPSLVGTKAFIGGKWVPAASGQMFKILDPEDDTEVCEVADLNAHDTRKAVEAASKAFETYKLTPHRERRWLMRRWGDLIRAAKDDLAALCTLELGKPFTESLTTVQYALDFIDHFETGIERTYGETIPAARGNNRILTIREPQGVVACITPWNSPVAMVTRKVGAALAAGNTVVCKPAPETPLCAIALAKLFERAGGPPGVFNIVTAGQENTPAVGEELCKNPAIKHLSFTGSTTIGRLLNVQCAKTIKKTSLELGGNAPFIVFEDADLKKAANGVIASKFRSSGQTCVCANRIYVHSSIMDAFADTLSDTLKATFVYGSVWDAKVNFGPLYSGKGLAKVEAHLQDAIQQGSRVSYRGTEDNLGPNFFPPTVVVVPRGETLMMKFLTEETFGPLAFLVPFDSEEEVVRLANATDVGLAAYFFTESISRVWRVSEALKVGMVGVGVGLVSAAEQPFGGVLESGLGREGGPAALEEYLDIKSITVGI